MRWRKTVGVYQRSCKCKQLPYYRWEQKITQSSSKIGPEMQSKTVEIQIEFTLISTSSFLALVPPLAAHGRDFKGPSRKNNDCWVSFESWEQHSTISRLTDWTSKLSLFLFLFVLKLRKVQAPRITTFIMYQQRWGKQHKDQRDNICKLSLLTFPLVTSLAVALCSRLRTTSLKERCSHEYLKVSLFVLY